MRGLRDVAISVALLATCAVGVAFAQPTGAALHEETIRICTADMEQRLIQRGQRDRLPYAAAYCECSDRVWAATVSPDTYQRFLRFVWAQGNNVPISPEDKAAPGDLNGTQAASQAVREQCQPALLGESQN